MSIIDTEENKNSRRDRKLHKAKYAPKTNGFPLGMSERDRKLDKIDKKYK